MHFQLDPNTEAYRDEVHAHLEQVLTPEFEERVYRSGVAHDHDFALGLVDKGYFAPNWPEEFGGLAFGYKGLGVVTEETGRTLTASPLIATVWVGGTILNLGGSRP